MTIGQIALAAMLAMVALNPPAFACPAPEQGFRRLASSEAEVAYRWDPAELKVGRFFAAEVIACKVPHAEPVREIRLDATMPAHGHGMNYLPAATETAPGHYKFTGIMLHMTGTWRLTIDLVQGNKRVRLTHDLKLAP